jgi:hypothetical protein
MYKRIVNGGSIGAGRRDLAVAHAAFYAGARATLKFLAHLAEHSEYDELPRTIERRGMDKHILSTAILRYETESLFRVVPFDCADTFLCRPRVRVSLRGGTRRRTPLSPARHLSSTCVHVDDFRDLKALLPLADPDFHASPPQARCYGRHLKRSCVHERIGSACYGDKPETLLGIEPFDDCFDRL